jgi:flavodoxin
MEKKKMKRLVVYFSKSGNTKRVGQALAENLSADIDEIVDRTDREGFLNWFRAGRDGMQRRLTKVQYARDPEKYDLVLIGTPVWGWNMVPAVRTYLTENKGRLKSVAFFSTSGGTNVQQTFADMERSSQPPVALLSITEKELRSNTHQRKLIKFCEKIRALKPKRQ